ncbi:MAG: hypothetical protein U5R30_05155 [Deltaproteobacteria bacterium]|nr:hypothetical protein [Deltaproteobacteria bacterium]
MNDVADLEVIDIFEVFENLEHGSLPSELQPHPFGVFKLFTLDEPFLEENGDDHPIPFRSR